MALTEFGKLVHKYEWLENQLIISNTHLHLYTKLAEAQKGEFHEELFRSLDFWGYTIMAHAQAAILGLCRLYDDRRKSDVFHLMRFLQEVESKTHTFTDRDQESLVRDLAFVQRADPKVRKLRQWRHNVVAHQNLGLVLGGREDFLKQFPVQLDEIQALLDEGFAMLGRWGRHYVPQRQASASTRRLACAEDEHLLVLEALRTGLPRRTVNDRGSDASQTPRYA